MPNSRRRRHNSRRRRSSKLKKTRNAAQDPVGSDLSMESIHKAVMYKLNNNSDSDGPFYGFKVHIGTVGNRTDVIVTKMINDSWSQVSNYYLDCKGCTTFKDLIPHETARMESVTTYKTTGGDVEYE